ncbi:hypothetical protein HKX48_008950 [Thoreauomyces humboldtii]|nr:hypothetical protein HKX48_008950 [Thoreauomyces humboldtii]
MWKKNEISVSASSVVDLKAELFKKQEEFAKEKLRTGSATTRAISSKPIKKPPKNRGVDDRAARDARELPALASSLEASWVALQRKTKIYDKLSKEGGAGDEGNEDELVDFLHKNGPEEEAVKAADVTEEDGDGWVEAVDEFGRTRIVRQSQVEKLGLSFVKGGQGTSDDHDDGSGPSLLSDDMRREMERVAWEKNAEAELLSETNGLGHFDSRKEIRTLGVGFYQFSQNDEDRKRQMDALNTIRDDTLDSQKKTTMLKNIRKDRLEDRKRALKERAAKRRKTTEQSAVERDRGDVPGTEGAGDEDVGTMVDDFLNETLGNVS